MPLPETSPTTTSRLPSGFERVWKKSPPTVCAGRYSDSTEKTGECSDLGHEHALLQHLRLFHVERDDLAGEFLANLGVQEAAHHQRTDHQDHQNPGDAANADADAKGKERAGRCQRFAECRTIKLANSISSDGQCGQQRLGTIATKAFDEDDEEQHAHARPAPEGGDIGRRKPGQGWIAQAKERQICARGRPAFPLPQTASQQVESSAVGAARTSATRT